MSHVNEALLEIAEKIIDQLALQEDDSDQIQAIILDNHLPLDDYDIVHAYFRDIVLCPQCSSLLGPKCDCWQQTHD
jgi:hypothetical protein